MSSANFFEGLLNQELGASVALESSEFVSGGCINNTLKLTTSSGNYFLKWNRNQGDLFEKEKLGLELLAEFSPLRVPAVISYGNFDGNDFLLLAFIEKGIPSTDFWKKFSKGLAEQHQVRSNEFGLDHDNHIGRLPQSNSSKPDWVTFFIENRLNPQLKIAELNGLIDGAILERFDRLFSNLSSLFPDEEPSLLHGDLWSGNFMTASDGEVCVFDPAIYYGHREAELAFTHMFGGFDPSFYEGYNEVYPLSPGFDQRIDLYNLYPLLVHLNLFGRSYLNSVNNVLKRYCK